MRSLRRPTHGTRRTAAAAPPRDDATELAAMHASTDQLRAVLRAAAAGDLEARVGRLEHPGLAPLRDELNGLLDVVDAFVREAGASMTAAAGGQLHRRMLVRGMPGAFRDGAQRIDAARGRMRRDAEELAELERSRETLVGEVVEVSAHVAAASVELGATAATLSAATRAGVGEVERALHDVERLQSSSQEIGAAVTLIRKVAEATRLLSMNARIEAATAGDAGRGFAVVAAEVKALADEVSTASEDITDQVRLTQELTASAVDDMTSITALMRTMDSDVADVAAAAGDDGLARMAQALSARVSRFTEQGPEPTLVR